MSNEGIKGVKRVLHCTKQNKKEENILETKTDKEERKENDRKMYVYTYICVCGEEREKVRWVTRAGAQRVQAGLIKVVEIARHFGGSPGGSRSKYDNLTIVYL